MVLIDKQGRIAYKGKPTMRPDLAEDIANLFEDKVMEAPGEGCAPVVVPVNADGVPSGYIPMSEAQDRVMNKDMDLFPNVAADLNTTLTTDDVKGLHRSLCVLVLGL